MLKRIGIAIVIMAVLGIFVPVVLFPRYISTSPQKATSLPAEDIPAGIDTTFVITNATVIPMDSERLLPGHTVVIRDGVIIEIAPDSTAYVPSNAFTINADGRFLLPGLTDMHVHLCESANDLLLNLANGITTVRDMGSSPVLLEWRQEIIRGTRTGPNLWIWSPYIRELDFPDRTALILAGVSDIVSVNSTSDAHELVRKYKAMGYDGIKIHHPVHSFDIYKALLSEAHSRGLYFDGHVPDKMINCSDREKCWKDFHALHIDGVVHAEELVKIVGYADSAINAAAKDVADAGIGVATTYMYTTLIPSQYYDLAAKLASMDDLKYVNPGVINRGIKSLHVTLGWSPGYNRWERDPDEPDELRQRLAAGKERYFAALEKMILALHEHGAQLLAGTSANNTLVVPGFSLHDELEALVHIGLSPYEALRTSTVNPAVYLRRLDEFGTIEENKQASLVLLDANPLEDIANARRINGVMVRGRWYTRDDIDTMLQNIAKANTRDRR